MYADAVCVADMCCCCMSNSTVCVPMLRLRLSCDAHSVQSG